jgi:hypothetical protein
MGKLGSAKLPKFSRRSLRDPIMIKVREIQVVRCGRS